ncbi:molybdenum cofactor sulfurase isoform X2 [Salvia hispanica]|uniref:molybdenum cofactor sulfurase isoform X2 n=1 Tax=Salvia hispanica TaxID=49212 RepID=UPI0020097EEF|nr:molybdenum cofactor sulfurase isoform X2 [Salvia hispanica]
MDGEFDKERFLKEFGGDYGYPNALHNIDQIRANDFKRLNDVVYLDHAGATLYSESQMQGVFKDLSSTLYGNPHSQSSCSVTTSDIVGEVRQQVLSFFNASPREYKCIFTSGATSSLKLVGETFPWSRGSNYVYTMENHNSVLGIREYALRQGAAAIAVDIEDITESDAMSGRKSGIKIVPHTVQRRGETDCGKIDETNMASYEAVEKSSFYHNLNRSSYSQTILNRNLCLTFLPVCNIYKGETYNLFAFPSECNFSGLRFNLDLVNSIKEGSCQIPGTFPTQSGHWMVLIDAAKGSSTCPPDLSKYKADFVVVSFYKLFGYPTGIGALIARNESVKLLKKTYFSGGTVAASIADIDFYQRRDGVEEYFEDGTVSFLSIASLHHGFKVLNTLTMPAISRNALLKLRHENGNCVCILYGINDNESLFDSMGPVISFNLKRPDGSWFGYREVEKLASLSNIQLRTGCFCNPGACAKHLGLSHSDLVSNIEAGHVCWDDHDILNGKPTGAVRVSFGYMSTFEDAMKLLKFIKSSFVPQMTHNITGERPYSATEGVERTSRYFLKSITVYPIKSCAGFSVGSWPLSNTGLLHDREWLLKSFNGEILTQKKVPEMGLISTLVDLKLGLLIVESPHCKEKMQIELSSAQCIGKREVMEIHSQRYEVGGYWNEIDIWFSNAVGRPCTLVRSYAVQNQTLPNREQCIVGMCRDFETRLNFVNEAQFLLLLEESVSDLNSRIRSKLRNDSLNQPAEINPMRFRPNIVVSGGKPYAEDGWKSLKIGESNFKSLGGCNRCHMINMTSTAGTVQRSNEPLATLASYRRLKGKIYFGILLRLCDFIDQDAWISVGQEVMPNTD